MKKIIFFTVLYCSNFAYGQVDSVKTKTDSAVVSQPAPTTPPPAKVRKDTRPLKERISFGFGTSVWFNSQETFIELAPVVAYRFPKTLITGFGYRYIYRHDRLIGKDLSSYGPNVFARVNLIPKIYLWTEYEILHNQYYVQTLGKELAKETSSTNSWFAGLGFVKSVGKRGGISFQVLYNILYDKDEYSPYYSAWSYRVGYFF